MIKKLLYIIVLNLLSSIVFAYPIAPTGARLNSFLDNLDVTKRWLPNHEINWSSGASYGHYQGSYGTHCSTFVAAAAARLGVYILRPPEHEDLLANAQYYWLRSQGAKHGWAHVDSHITAQKIANQGCLVVISYANPNRRKPGHIAIVRPSNKSTEEIIAKGPQIIQAGRKNYNSTDLSKAFRHHQTAFRKHKILYYAHATPFCRLQIQKEGRGHSSSKTL